ncbi:hypothetical protein CK203_037097 [Vitis vinifera]|uniref:Reverse transcriptase zinc-binding domain-containing protein n=1 Tax=Vitis vinifera TaxID=29760 RepID=A0A438I5R2_VITVI|nr:hypothetical protein CK203_037097 [Vitis vinifera]
MVLPSTLEIRGKGPSFLGNCGLMVAENLEVPMENRVNSEFFFKKDNDAHEGQTSVDIPTLEMEVVSLLFHTRCSRVSTLFRLIQVRLLRTLAWLQLTRELPWALLREEEQMLHRIVRPVGFGLEIREVVLGSFSVSIKFALDGCESLWLSAVYGPNNSALRKDFWMELSDIFGLSSPRWCVGGDFNVIRRSSEKLGGSRLTPNMKDFDDFIRDCELIDSPLRSAPFTWSNFLQEVLPRWTSDHWLIVLETNPFKWGPTPFRFENMWLQHLSFKESFGSWWREFQGNGWEGHKFMRKLQFIKAKLKEWNKASFGELIQRALRKGELEELILREEIHWRQKARVKWVKEGDCNSSFFHKVANGKRNRKFIKELENESGLMLNNSESIKEEILRYFEKLYASPSGEPWRVEGLDWSPISGESASRASKRGTSRNHPSTQGAFVQGRQILDAVLIANEIVDEKEDQGRLAKMLDYKASGWPILYLGLPMGGNPKACGFWDPVIERISRRLDGWQKAYLSFGGKWLWRYPREGSALWHQVILSIYGSHSNDWDVNNIIRCSHRCPWKAIAQIFQEFSEFTRFVVEDGDRIRLWEGFVVPFKVKSFVWLVAHKKINTNDLLQLRRPYKAFSPDIYYFN